MSEEASFLKNIVQGIGLYMKKIFSGRRDGSGLNLLKEKYLKHLPGNKVHSYRLLGKETHFRKGPDFLAPLREIFIDKDYAQALQKNAMVIDCGAHIGLSIIYIKQICPSAEIICFEPDKTNFELLQKNIESHQLDKVTAINKAVWIENKELFFSSKGTMSSRITESSVGAGKISACRLYDFLNREINFLKIDIEGAEYRVLKDIEPRLKNVQRMFIEYHGTFSQNPELIEMLEIIGRNGFHFYIKEAGPVYPQPFTGIRGDSIYDLQLNIFCIRN